MAWLWLHASDACWVWFFLGVLSGATISAIPSIGRKVRTNWSGSSIGQGRPFDWGIYQLISAFLRFIKQCLRTLATVLHRQPAASSQQPHLYTQARRSWISPAVLREANLNYGVNDGLVWNAKPGELFLLEGSEVSYLEKIARGRGLRMSFRRLTDTKGNVCFAMNLNGKALHRCATSKELIEKAQRLGIVEDIPF